VGAIGAAAAFVAVAASCLESSRSGENTDLIATIENVVCWKDYFPTSLPLISRSHLGLRVAHVVEDCSNAPLSRREAARLAPGELQRLISNVLRHRTLAHQRNRPQRPRGGDPLCLRSCEEHKTPTKDDIMAHRSPPWARRFWGGPAGKEQTGWEGEGREEDCANGNRLGLIRNARRNGRLFWSSSKPKVLHSHTESLFLPPPPP